MTRFADDLEDIFETMLSMPDFYKEELYENFRTVINRKSGQAYWGISQPGQGRITEDSNTAHLEALVETATREATSLENTTVYQNIGSMLEESDSFDTFIENLQHYVELKKESRADSSSAFLEDTREQIGNYGGEDPYINEIVEDLTAEVLKESNW